MKAAVILVVLAVLSSSLAVPVIDIFKDKEFRNGMLNEHGVGKSEDSRRQNPFGRRKKLKILKVRLVEKRCDLHDWKSVVESQTWERVSNSYCLVGLKHLTISITSK